MRYRRAVKLTVLSGFVILWVRLGDKIPIRPFCLFHKITGIPCPGCGGTRAAELLMSGNFVDALYTNPLSVVFCAFLFVFAVSLWVDCIRKKDTLYSLISRPWKPIPTIIVSVIILANWIWNIYKGI